MKQVRAVFFSPTGTTRRIAAEVADTAAGFLALPLIRTDITPPEARKKPLCFSSEELVVFALPVYAGRLPNLLLPFLKQSEGNGALAVPLVVFGNRNYDDALPELCLLLEACGFRLIAAAAFVGEHAFSRTLGAGRPNETDLSLARQFAKEIARGLSEGRTAVRGTWTLLGEPERPLRPYYQPQDRYGEPISILKVKPRIDAEKCTRCGRCASLCPMGSISISGLPQIAGICIKCGACEKGCPSGAVFFDDPGYLYHRSELEELYARPANPSLFL